MSSPHTCMICKDEYDSDVKIPRILPCGHTFCQKCLEVDYKNLRICCYCRLVNRNLTISNCYVNYALIDTDNQTKFKALTTNAIKTLDQISEVKKKISQEMKILLDKKSNFSDDLFDKNLVNKIYKVEDENNRYILNKCSKEYNYLSLYENKVFREGDKVVSVLDFDNEHISLNSDEHHVESLNSTFKRIDDVLYRNGNKRKALQNMLKELEDGRIIHVINEGSELSNVELLEKNAFHMLSAFPHSVGASTYHKLNDIWFKPFPAFVVAFIDLKLENKSLGRVYFKIDTSSDHGQMFLMMCTREHKISHKDSGNFYRSFNKDNDFIVLGRNTIDVYKTFKSKLNINIVASTSTSLNLGSVYVKKVDDMSQVGRFYIAMLNTTNAGMARVITTTPATSTTTPPGISSWTFGFGALVPTEPMSVIPASSINRQSDVLKIGEVLHGIDNLERASKEECYDSINIDDCGIVFHL